MTADRWRQIEHLFHEARQRPPAERKAFLAAACGDDVPLNREVQSLLDQQDATLLREGITGVAAGMSPLDGPTGQTGRALGRYTLGALLGAGGMGEVYRARDTQLGRNVAVKVLPAALGQHPDRLARFDREARVLAALNHPHIGAIYGIEESDGIRGLVLELVDGVTLAERLAAGPLPVREALSYASEIADALEAAHDRHIVHRDLKPANIKITSGGILKVLDFGLAKAARDESGDAALVAPMVTTDGMVVGTASYMSPEQARGLAVDKRTDIWAFGCVLYEMLTGAVAFRGDTLSDVIAGVLGRPPDWTALPSATPPAIRRLLRRCLEKDQRRRLRDAGDARLDIDEALAGASDDASPGVARAGAGRDVAFQRLTDFAGMNGSPAVSPDGKMVAYVALVAGNRQIWIRLMSGGPPLQVTRDHVNHEQPRWAPDSSALIYYTPAAQPADDGTIWEISALGGWPRRVATATAAGDISPDGLGIALFQLAGEQSALMIVKRDGSRSERVALLPTGHTYTSPRWSPDGRSIAFERSSAIGISVALDVVPVSGGRPREIAQGAWLKGFCWLPDGSGLVYSSSRGSAMLYPPVFNLRTIAIDGGRDCQLTYGDQSFVEPDTHRTRKVLATRIKGPSDIWRIPVSGSPLENTHNATRITRQTGQVRTPSVNADDSEVVYLSDSGGHGNLWVARTDRSSVRQITFEDDPTVAIGLPKWSPTGDLIAFIVSRSGQVGLSIVRADGSGRREIVADGRGPCWSGDGRWLYYESSADGVSRLEKISIAGGQSIVVREEGGAGHCAAGPPELLETPAVSSDGSALYYTARSNISGVGRTDAVVCCVRPEGGPSEVLARVSSERIPGLPPVLHAVLSPDDQWLAMPLIDGATTNLWALPAAGGAMKQLTDFGDRSIVIARSVSWSPDSQYLYAAVSESETDVVLIDGLIG